ncbi:zinc finger protein Xfin-like [Planococcus citri]|uniref:zinc finger protein Xfin-like n=1 Tax=Planococcus citri TaxID=170843 RepID=UPI0031F9B57A
MLKDFIDSENDATPEFLTDMAEINDIMSEEITSDTTEVEHVVTTLTIDDEFDIECSSVTEEIEDVKVFDSSPNTEVIEVIENDNVEELQSPISDQVEEFIINEHINSKQVLANNEFGTVLDKILPNNDLMEIDTPFLNGNTSQDTNDVEFVSQTPASASSDTISTEAAVKRYKCHICGKLFSRNSSLKCHIRLHVEGPDSLLRGSSEPLENLKSRFTELVAKKEKEEVIESVDDENATDSIVQDELAIPDELNTSRDSVDLTEDGEKRDYKCILCPKTFSRKSSLTFHYRFHPKSPSSKSPDDITVQNTNDETAMETDSHATKVQFKCTECPRTFDQKNAYAWHLKMHSTNVRRKSNEVVPVANRNDVQEMIVDSTGDVDITKYRSEVPTENDAEHLYKCHLCPKSFPSLRGLKTHSGVHKKRKFSKPSIGSEQLNQIVYEEVSSRKYPCALKDHNHDDEVTKLYKCNVCCKCFCDIVHLRKHLARNHREDDISDLSDEDYVPESQIEAIETKKVARKSRKQVSPRVSDDFIEQKERIAIRGLYKCGVCNEAFDEIQLLADHVNIHLKAHNDSLLDISDDTPAEELCCVGCNVTFRNRNALSRHMNEHRRQEEEILVRVTSSGRKIRERRSSEDLTANSPIKCIPCNRYFESIRAKRIHDSSKHPVAQSESEEPESETDDESSDEQSNKDYVCKCCNKSWNSVRALGIHRSWNQRQSLPAPEEPGVAPLMVEDEDPLDSDTYAEDNKTENDVSSSVKCGRCNELFPNIPALNAHRCGETNGTMVDSVNTTSNYEKNDMASGASLRDLVKCDRCDKFFVGIPALKLHIISDHSKKSVTQNTTEEQNSTTTAGTVPDNVVQTQSETDVQIVDIVDPLADIPTQPNDKPAVVSVSQTVRGRKSILVGDSAKPQEQTDDRKYACCDKTFTSLKGLKTHQRNHPTMVTLPAAIASSTSRESAKLQLAKNDAEKADDYVNCPTTDTEAEEGVFKEYTCSICFKVFEWQKQLRYHRKKKHFGPDEDDPEDGIGEFQCSKCHKRFDKISSLRVHKAYHTTKEKKTPIDCGTYTDMRNGIYKCNKCDKEFDNVRSSITHHNIKHKTPKEGTEYPCTLCDRSFTCSQGLAGHMWAHKRGCAIDSTQLNETSPAAPVLETDLYCTLCHKSFTKKGNLMRHRRSFHKIDVADEDNIEEEEEEEEEEHDENETASTDRYCRLCDKSFTTKGNFIRHRRCVHKVDVTDEDNIGEEQHDENETVRVNENGEKEYSCTDCDRVFTNYRGLNGHRQMHQMYTCSECDEKFTNLRLYNTHRETQCLQFKCDKCDRTFKSARALGGHKPTHYGEKGKENESDDVEDFQDAENDLDDESKETNNESEFKCDKCDRTFKSARALGSHKPSHHGEKSDESESDNAEEYLDAENESGDEADNEEDGQSNEYQCSRCDRSYNNQRSLNVHMTCHLAHDNPLELPCPQCERIFSSHRSLSAHYLTHRGNTLHEFPCPKCNIQFTTMRSMHEHFCTAHKRRSRSKRPARGDSKPISNDTEIVVDSKDTEAESTTATPAVVPIVVEHPCAKCGQKFDSESTLIDHKKVCKTRSRSVGARMSSRGDNLITPATNGDDPGDTPNSKVEKNRRRAKSSPRLSESSQLLNREQPMEVDVQKDRKKSDEDQAAKSHMQLSCVINDQINTTGDTEAAPKCDLCSLTFEDLKSLAKHMADSHESTTNNSVEAKSGFANLPIRVHHCTQCDKIFANRIGLRRHSLTHAEPAPLPVLIQCPSCPRQFFSIVGLRRHSSVHKNGRKSIAICNLTENTPAYDSSATESKTNRVAIPLADSVVENHAKPASSTSDVDRPLVEQSVENSTNGVDESINAANQSLPEPDDQIVPCHNAAIARVDNSVEDVTISSNDIQPDQPIDEMNLAQDPVPAVSNEAGADFSCYKCKRRFGNVKKLNKHLQFHKFNDGVKGEEPSVNESPQQRRSSDAGLTNGNASVDLAVYVKCEICGNTFKNAEILKKHAFDTHNVTITSPLLYYCDVCHKPFSRGKSLISHLKTHTNGYSSSSSEEDGMPYECISCEKCFRLKSDLLEHVKTHDSNNHEIVPAEPLVNGSVDEKSATLNGNMSDVSVHSENYELRIISDDDDIADNGNLVAEPIQVVHQPEPGIIPKPKIECTECGRSFKKLHFLRIHSRIHRKTPPAPKPKPNPNLDPTITRSTSSKTDHKCPECEMSFSLKTSLAIHMQKHTGVKVSRRSLKRAHDGDDLSAEDGVKNSKRASKDIS